MNVSQLRMRSEKFDDDDDDDDDDDITLHFAEIVNTVQVQRYVP